MSVIRLLFFILLFNASFTVFSAPHTKISTILQQLKAHGYKSIASKNDFESSLTCEACGDTLGYSKSSQAVWVLRRHTAERSHQIRAGWLLDYDGNVKSAKPKGKKLSPPLF